LKSGGDTRIVKGIKANESLLDGYTMENLDQESMRKTAKRFWVSEYFIYRLKRRYKEVGTLAPKPHGGGHGPLVDKAGGGFIREVLAEAPDLTLNELCQRYERRFARKDQ
jgi:transposase